MGKLDEPSISQTNKTVHRQSEVDEVVGLSNNILLFIFIWVHSEGYSQLQSKSSLLYETLRLLRAEIAEESAGCGVHHIFK